MKTNVHYHKESYKVKVKSPHENQTRCMKRPWLPLPRKCMVWSSPPGMWRIFRPWGWRFWILLRLR